MNAVTAVGSVSLISTGSVRIHPERDHIQPPGVNWRQVSAVASHPAQGWSLLCNGVVLFDDGGALLPDGRAVLPATASAVLTAA